MLCFELLMGKKNIKSRINSSVKTRQLQTGVFVAASLPKTTALIFAIGRAGFAAVQAGADGHEPFLPGGGARQVLEAEQVHPPQPQGYPLQGNISSIKKFYIELFYLEA